MNLRDMTPAQFSAWEAANTYLDDAHLLADDDVPCPEACRQQAEDEVERTPEQISWWLGKVIDGWERPAEAKPVAIGDVERKLAQHEACTPAELLAVLFNSRHPAAIALRDMARADKCWAGDVDSRAAEIEEEAS